MLSPEHDLVGNSWLMLGLHVLAAHRYSHSRPVDRFRSWSSHPSEELGIYASASIYRQAIFPVPDRQDTDGALEPFYIGIRVRRYLSSLEATGSCDRLGCVRADHSTRLPAFLLPSAPRYASQSCMNKASLHPYTRISTFVKQLMPIVKHHEDIYTGYLAHSRLCAVLKVRQLGKWMSPHHIGL